MRLAVVTDIHGNLTALEAVLADLRKIAPDLVLHGGDLADSGSSPIAIVDSIRDLGWCGVMGNTDEMLVNPKSLEAFAAQSPAPVSLWAAIREIADATRSALGEERLSWMSTLPLKRHESSVVLVHASAESCWKAPSSAATEEEIQVLFGSPSEPVLVFGHTHQPFVRRLDGCGKVLVNAGSVGLSYDGDPRASYALLDGNSASIRRVEYDLTKELKLLAASRLPGASWTAEMLRTATPQNAARGEHGDIVAARSADFLRE